MKTPILPILVAAVMLGGCAHHVTAPDATKLTAAAEKASHAIVTAKAAVKGANEAMKAAQAAHEDERKRLGELAPKVDYAFSIAPQEMKPLVAEMQMQVVGLQEAQMLTDQRISEAQAKTWAANTKIEEANGATNEAIRLKDEYITASEKIVMQANKVQTENAHLLNIIGLLGAVALAGASVPFMRLAGVYGFAIPLLAAPAGYFMARWLV